MFESCAIARYLANNYGNDNYWPEDPIQRAQVDMWAEWSKLNVTSAFSIPLFWPIVRLDPALQNHKQLSTALAKLSKNLDIANDRLANNAFLVADQLTLADTVFGHMLYRYYDMDFDQANLSRPEHKHIRSYYDRLTQMEKYQKVVMIPYDELRFKS